MTETPNDDDEMREFARQLFTRDRTDDRDRGIFTSPTTKENNS